MEDICIFDAPPPVIGEFWGQYRFLSNFYPSPIMWDGREWPTVEHAYQAAKSPHSHIQAQIRHLPTPGAAKKAGRVIELRPDWEQVKLTIMAQLVYLKFKQNPSLAEKLDATGAANLVEGNTWGDRFWGVCPPNTDNGQNHLGWILMEVREMLRNERA